MTAKIGLVANIELTAQIKVAAKKKINSKDKIKSKERIDSKNKQAITALCLRELIELVNLVSAADLFSHAYHCYVLQNFS